MKKGRASVPFLLPACKFQFVGLMNMPPYSKVSDNPINSNLFFRIDNSLLWGYDEEKQ
jgi:hypothetical protein